MAQLEAEVQTDDGEGIRFPEGVARLLGIEPGDRFDVTVDEADPEVICLRRLRRSYAGVAAGAYGSLDEVEAIVRGDIEAGS